MQTVYPLSDSTGLALTTQHYYTPSGRLIQRDYSNLSFLDYYYGKRSQINNPTDVKQTDLGRVVYGGGGISSARILSSTIQRTISPAMKRSCRRSGLPMKLC